MSPRQRLPLALLLAALTLGACGESEPEGNPPLAPQDSALALILADLHLADARAETTGEPLDSLRAVALDLHGLDSTALDRRLTAATRTPEASAALAGAVSDALTRRTAPPSP